jgi:signal transduction histidine kinase
MQGLLDYGKPPSPTLRPEPIHTVVADAAAVCAALAGERNVKLTDGIPSSFPPVRMDRKRLAQVFENLLQNAIQHSPRGGMVAVEGALEEEEAAASLVLTVTDSGPGFAREDLPHVFEPFFSRRRGGTGLGLAIVQRIVEEHGGIIRAANRPGGGAAVTVRLPVADH